MNNQFKKSAVAKRHKQRYLKQTCCAFDKSKQTHQPIFKYWFRCKGRVTICKLLCGDFTYFTLEETGEIYGLEH